MNDSIQLDLATNFVNLYIGVALVVVVVAIGLCTSYSATSCKSWAASTRPLLTFGFLNVTQSR